jgi:membrane-associated protein
VPPLFAGSIGDAVGELDGARPLVVYLVVMMLVAVEALLPILPGETAVVTAATWAARGDLSVVGVFIAAWLGALTGDLFLYTAGRTGSEKITRWLTRGVGADRLEAGRYFFRRYGQPFLVVGRFVPGLRVLNALTAGALEMPLPRYLRAEIPGAALWAAYASWLGYAVGSRSTGSVWVSLAVSGAATVVLSAVVGVFWKKADAARRAEQAAGQPAR